MAMHELTEIVNGGLFSESIDGMGGS